MKTVSLFAGCGGLDLGFKKAGFDVIWANDNNKKLTQTYAKNHSNTKFIVKSITNIKSEEIPECDVIIGGPPCQSWSLGGAMRGKSDSRGKLFYEYVRIIKDKKPLAFVAENVKGIVSSSHIDSFNEIVEMFKKSGYIVKYKVLNAKNYGVPQDRERVFIVGIRRDLDVKYEFPLQTHNKDTYVSLKDAIGDLIDNPGEYFEGSFSPIFMSRNRRRNWDSVAFTVQASGRQTQLHPDNPEMISVGKDKRVFDTNSCKKIRRLSVMECARIQNFPNDFEFLVDSLNEKYKMIGNAVPISLGQAVAKSLKECLVHI